ncbi:hypothetical protein YC2023_097979 [Brassica napus]
MSRQLFGNGFQLLKQKLCGFGKLEEADKLLANVLRTALGSDDIEWLLSCLTAISFLRRLAYQLKGKFEEADEFERDKIGSAPYDGCLRTLVEGLKLFVVRLGVKVLMTCFPARPLRSSFYVAVTRRVAADGILYGCRRKITMCKLAGFLKTLEYCQRDKFWDLVSRFLILCLEMLETSALGLGQDLGLLLVLEGAMTKSTYVSRFSFILIPYQFKVRDRFSAYTTCMVGTEHLSKDNF